VSYTQPLILVFGVVALIGVLRLRPRSKALIAIWGLAGLLLISWPPVDWLISRLLVFPYPVRQFQRADFEAIVVLSEAVEPPHWERPFPVPSFRTYERCLYAALLFRQSPRPILVCGGPSSPGETPSSITMKEVIQQSGVPRAMIWTEESSRNTRENAVYGAAILRQREIQRIAFVVEAQSMMRAEACFRKQGITVVPAPSAFREFGPISSELLPSWRAIEHNELALHEMLGLGWYRLRGWI